MKPELDAIIVGGGPVGLLLACLLQKRGLSFRVLEKRTQPITHSAAIGITPPSLHILDQLGLAREFIEAGVKVYDCFVHGRKSKLGRVTFRDIPDEHRFILSLPQATTISILQSHLGTECMQTGCEVTGITQHADHCVVQTNAGEFTTRFVIACDGARGRVREFIGMQAPVKPYDCHFVMGDFIDRTDFGDAAHLFFTPTGSVESFPLPGGQRRWIVQTDQRLDAPPKGLVSYLTHLRTGINVPSADQVNESVFTPRRFNCDRYYSHRVILCGDAAHGMSPIGGQGMNTGFADAEFLAEVLAKADPLALLPAYNRFRRTAAKTAIFRAEWGMWLGTWRGNARSALRDVILKFLLCQGPVARRMGPFYAMLTIPFNTLARVPQASLRPHTA